MDSGGCPLPTESLIKKALILEASGLAGSRGRFLASGGWSFAIERLANKGCCVLDISHISGNRYHCLSAGMLSEVGILLVVVEFWFLRQI